MRIVSICPSNTELAAYLGLEDQLVGVDDYSDWPQSITTLPRLGPDLSIDMDKLEALQPDLVLASLSVPGMEKNIKELVQRDIPHVVYNPQSLDDIASDLIDLGKRTGREEYADHVVSLYQSMISDYKSIALQVEKQTLYWEWWPKPVFTPGRTNWLTEISSLSGGENAFIDKEEASVQTDWEDVYNRNPDHICLAWVGVQTNKVKPELLLKRPDWPELPAVAENRVHVLPEPLYCRPSPRLLLGLKKLAAILHPEHFPADDDVDPLLQQA
ncbi:cobalamin-binding protein [Alkalihalophilus marmarensis]|uniref:ABC transporter substrate-binding protein n=1 Tax=Alkalihalophilus marmarensis DSM 21297 TaxID=1188261 RepID=U6SNJ0_9BACI|nr:cobalamin-binding protein [Alkalihalophilus marmarensis]ERN52206.1 ABC transporter substrate-binding protein [Alkalihalophilus marmarensis DSM 21297]